MRKFICFKKKFTRFNTLTFSLLKLEMLQLRIKNEKVDNNVIFFVNSHLIFLFKSYPFNAFISFKSSPSVNFHLKNIIIKNFTKLSLLKKSKILK